MNIVSFHLTASAKKEILLTFLEDFIGTQHFLFDEKQYLIPYCIDIIVGHQILVLKLIFIGFEMPCDSLIYRRSADTYYLWQQVY